MVICRGKLGGHDIFDIIRSIIEFLRQLTPSIKVERQEEPTVEEWLKKFGALQRTSEEEQAAIVQQLNESSAELVQSQEQVAQVQLQLQQREQQLRAEADGEIAQLRAEIERLKSAPRANQDLGNVYPRSAGTFCLDASRVGNGNCALSTTTLEQLVVWASVGNSIFPLSVMQLFCAARSLPASALLYVYGVSRSVQLTVDRATPRVPPVMHGTKTPSLHLQTNAAPPRMALTQAPTTLLEPGNGTAAVRVVGVRLWICQSTRRSAQQSHNL
jgi:hypothetical protein